MNKSGTLSIFIFGLCMIAGLSVLYWSGVKEKLIGVSSTTVERELPIYSVDTDKKQVALSFDAAWGNEDTQQILDVLKDNEVRATFFMTGSWVESYPDDVKRIQSAGHDLGNHSESHKEMSKLTTEERKEELMKVHNKVKELTGVEMNLFRPPYSDYNNDVILDAASCGYYTIQWNVDSLDWKDYGAESIVSTVCNNESLCNGAIILCHNGVKLKLQPFEGKKTPFLGIFFFKCIFLVNIKFFCNFLEIPSYSLCYSMAKKLGELSQNQLPGFLGGVLYYERNS